MTAAVEEKYIYFCDLLNEKQKEIDGQKRLIEENEVHFAEVNTLNVEKYQEQLKKIEDYRVKIEYFRTVAEKNITSKNFLDLKPLEINFTRLREWTMLIDCEEKDNAYARRVYYLARCNEVYLNLKQAEFEGKIAELTKGQTDEQRAIIEQAKRRIEQLEVEQSAILHGAEFEHFAKSIAMEYGSYAITMDSLKSISNDQTSSFCIGGKACPIPAPKSEQAHLKHLFGAHYDEATGSLIMPVSVETENEAVYHIITSPVRERNAYGGIQNLILNRIKNVRPFCSEKVIVIDAIHMNNAALGQLKEIEDSGLMPLVPRDSEAAMDALKKVVFTFADIDERLGLCDSVREYNESLEEGQKRIDTTTLVLIGYPDAFDGDAAKYIDRILVNHKRYGINVVLLKLAYSKEKKEDADKLSVEIIDSYYKVDMTGKRSTLSIDDAEPVLFRWEELNYEVPEEFVTSVIQTSKLSGGKGNEYPKRVPGIELMPKYERGSREIVLEYGIDQNDEVVSVGFDNENFAAYLMGASGSGKSTLLHNLITGVLMKFHPDDVELWLADFKMSEFAQYMDPLPPHVKYILLDESQELVFDLIDKLTDIMMERQRYFMLPQNRSKKKVENVKGEYMPVIFVMLDEFSIMSQAIEDSDEYKLKLQNLLAKGRALGIKFLFSSQTFSNGIKGLTTTAKAQIQSRIAMKNAPSDISDTLELSAAMKTEQVRNWIDALPPYYSLYKFRAAEGFNIKRVQVMYFPGKEDAMEPQRALIRRINTNLKPSDTYVHEDITRYVDKKPVLLDGNSFDSYNWNRFNEHINNMKNDPAADFIGDEVFTSLGTPRLMTSFRPVTITCETGENMFLLSRPNEQACTASILLSVMKDFEAQGGKAKIWAYSRNRLYRAYRNVFAENGYEVVEDIDAICDEIRNEKEMLTSGQKSDELIVMLGMERICNDFEFVTESAVGTASATGAGSTDEQLSQMKAEYEKEHEAAGIHSEVEEMTKTYLLALNEAVKPLLKELREKGMAREAIRDEIQKKKREFNLEYEGYIPLEDRFEGDPVKYELQPDGTVRKNAAKKAEEKNAEDKAQGAYNAKADLKLVIMHGSRTGRHYVFVLNNYSDFKPTGLKLDFFRHRVACGLTKEESSDIFGNRTAVGIPEHTFKYSDTLESFTFRPYLHKNVVWGGWDVDENGLPVRPGI